MDPRFSVKKNSDFRRIYAKGKSFVSPCMVVYCRKNRGSVNRSGYTVSAKLGHAVVRNRVRRRMREVYRLNSHLLKQGWDIIVVARTRSVNADFRTLESEFIKACSELSLLEEIAP